MLLIFGPPPSPPDFFPEKEGWSETQSLPKGGLLLAYRYLPGIVVAGLLTAVWVGLTDVDVKIFLDSLWLAFAILLPLIVVHELIHFAACPASGMSSQKGMGIWPDRFVAYVFFLGPMSRNRKIAVVLMPFLILSILPLAVAVFTGYGHTYIAYVTIWNALGSSNDIYVACYFMLNFRTSVSVRSSGGKLWWKDHAPLK